MAKQNRPLKKPVGAEDFHQLAVEHLKRGEFTEARGYLEKSLAVKKTARAFHDLGTLEHKSGKTMEAVEAFQAAVEIDPSWHQSHANLYRIMIKLNNVEGALRHCSLAICAGPEVPAYKENFIQIAQSVKFLVFNPLYKTAVLKCLEDYDDNHQEIVHLWYALVEKDPALLSFRKLMSAADYKNFSAEFSLLTDVKPFHDPFILLGLRRLLVPRVAFERFAINLRRLLLDGGASIFPEPPLAFMAALAEYFFHAEYAMNVTAAEQEKIESLKSRMDAAAICILGCYQPLCMLENAAAIEKKYSGDNILGAMIRAHISAPLKERALRETIPVLAPVNDAFSASVREQYEEFPYPRWKSLSKMYREEYMAKVEKGDAHTVLNAGCGTARHALSYAATLPQAEILAVDLSLSSLTYAKREAEERGIKNISFMQGNILKLGKLDRKFDVVQCTGVLHHMKDPMAGWRVLTKLLKPDGLMRMALYSELAREQIVAAQKIIAEKGYTGDADSIRKFREDFQAVLPEGAANGIINTLDFFSLSTCRDLLFHIHEMRFDVPMLQKSLEELGLEFVRFNLSSDVLRVYKAMFPADPHLNDLRNWAVFEEKYPATFLAMYQFWCRGPE